MTIKPKVAWRLFAFLMLLPACCLCQKGKLKFVERTELQGITYQDRSSTRYKKCGDKIYITQPRKSKGDIDSVIRLLPYNTSSNGLAGEVLVINYNQYKNSDSYSDFYVKNKDTLVLLTFKQVMLFTRSPAGNVFNPVNTSPNNDLFHQCSISGGNIILTNCYNFHRLDAKFKCGFKIHSLTTLQPGHMQELVFDGIGFTHHVSQFLDVCNGRILLANTLRNSIYIYDMEGHKTDSLGDNTILNPGIEKCPVNMVSDNKKFSIKDSIYRLSEFNKTLTRLEKAFYVNNNTIITSTIPNGDSKKRDIAIYKKGRDGKWKITSRKIKLKDDSKFWAWYYSRPIIFTDDHAYFVDFKIPSEISKVNEAYMKENPLLQLYKYESSY